MSRNQPQEGSQLPELKERLEIIRALPINMDDKIDVALVLLSEKLATHIYFCYPQDGQSALVAVEQKLIEAGLEVVRGSVGILGCDETGWVPESNHLCILYISASVENAMALRTLGETFWRYWNPNSPEIPKEAHGKLGRLFGYPESAISAWVDDQPMLQFADLPEDILNQDYSVFFHLCQVNDAICFYGFLFQEESL